MFHPSAFRRFVRDLLSGPDDLIVHAAPADDLTAVAEACGLIDLRADLAELAAVETFADFIYLTGGDA